MRERQAAMHRMNCKLELRDPIITRQRHAEVTQQLQELGALPDAEGEADDVALARLPAAGDRGGHVQ